MVKLKSLSAGQGIGTWLQQKITAVIMAFAIILTLVFLILSSKTVNANIASWQQLFSCSLVKIFAQLIFISLVVHAWIGMKDVWLDYVRSVFLRIVLHSLTALWLLGCLIYSIKILWM